jgi:hypothetical protein
VTLNDVAWVLFGLIFGSFFGVLGTTLFLMARDDYDEEPYAYTEDDEEEENQP